MRSVTALSRHKLDRPHGTRQQLDNKIQTQRKAFVHMYLTGPTSFLIKPIYMPLRIMKYIHKIKFCISFCNNNNLDLLGISSFDENEQKINK